MSERLLKAGKQTVLWMRRHKLRVASLAMMFVMLWPQPAQSQFLDPCCAILSAGLATISRALTSVVGGGLNNILGIDQGISNFERTVVSPVNLINQAKGTVRSLGGTYQRIQRLVNEPVASATLPRARQLEQNLLSANSGDIGSTSTDYAEVYGAVPPATEASLQVQNMVDMSDAVAQDAMKRAIEIDNLANLELQAARQLNQSIQTAAPGSAPIIEAEADAWLLRANAYTQSATADLLRVRAASLSNQGVAMKLGASASISMMQKLQNLLK